MATSLYAAPMLPPGGQLGDANGDPLNGGKVHVYQAGTTTDDASYPTYDDALAGTNANANPVTLDSAGRAQIWLQGERSYKVVVKDSAGSTIQTMDDYCPAQATANPAASEWVRETNAISYSTTSAFIVSSTDVTTRYHKGRRVKVVCTAGTLYGTVVSSVYASSTTVTVVLDGGNSLDAGLSQVNYSFVSSSNLYTGHPSTQDLPSFVRAYRGTDQSITTGAFRKIEFNTKEIDTVGEYDNATNYRFTPAYQSSGGSYQQCYLITARVTFKTSITSAQLAVYKNGSAVAINQQNLGLAGATMEITHLADNGGGTDYYEIFVSPSGNVDIEGGETKSSFMVRRVQ